VDEGAPELLRAADGRWTRLATAACRSLVRVLGPGLSLWCRERRRAEPPCSGSRNMGSGEQEPRLSERRCPSDEPCVEDSPREEEDAEAGRAGRSGGREAGGGDWSASARLALEVCKIINNFYSDSA
jgi:hypothetical protein